MLIDNSPPTSDREENVDPEEDPLEGPSRQIVQMSNISCKNCQKKDKLIRRLRYGYKKEIGKLKQETEKVLKEKHAIQKMLIREIKKNRQAKEPSSEEKVDNMIKSIDEDKKEEIKKKIMFSEIISKNLKDGFKELNKKDKREFSDIVIKNRDRLKMHKVLNKTSKFTVRPKKKISHSNELLKMDKIKQVVEDFFEDDSNTKISPDKK